MKALIVDDSRPIRRIESEILAELGFETTDANNGAQGAGSLGRGSSAAIGAGRLEHAADGRARFHQGAAAQRAFRATAVLMVTTETEPDQMLRALTAGADEYLMKPFRKEDLVEKLRLIGVVN